MSLILPGCAKVSPLQAVLQAVNTLFVTLPKPMCQPPFAQGVRPSFPTIFHLSSVTHVSSPATKPVHSGLGRVKPKVAPHRAHLEQAVRAEFVAETSGRMTV